MEPSPIHFVIGRCRTCGKKAIMVKDQCPQCHISDAVLTEFPEATVIVFDPDPNEKPQHQEVRNHV